MEIISYNLWENTPGLCEEVPTITAYIPDKKTHDCAFVIFPGGGYDHRAKHEGDGYARFLAEKGITAFAVAYRVKPHYFPLPILDARRAVRYVRHNADKFGIDKNKVVVMGSSAGGHLAAITSTYFEPIEFEGADEIDKEDFIPDAQVLCYPVIKLNEKRIGHIGSGINLLNSDYPELCEDLCADRLVSDKTPPAFVWHTFGDAGVNVINSLDYVKALRNFKIPTELHVFPHGPHGLGLPEPTDKMLSHIAQWGGYLLKWIDYMEL